MGDEVKKEDQTKVQMKKKKERITVRRLCVTCHESCVMCHLSCVACLRFIEQIPDVVSQMKCASPVMPLITAATGKWKKNEQGLL